jgi:hypothetical protein
MATYERLWTLGDCFVLNRFLRVLLYSSNYHTTGGKIMHLHMSREENLNIWRLLSIGKVLWPVSFRYQSKGPPNCTLTCSHSVFVQTVSI